MKYTTRIIIAGVILFFYSCGNGKLSTSNKIKPAFITAAEKIYKNGYRFSFNRDSSFVICTKEFKPTLQNPFNSLNYFVYNIKDDKIIFEDSLHDGSVGWLNNSIMKIKNVLEVANRDKGNIIIKYYNVKLKRYVSSDFIKQ